jgi:hypothetical protein
MPLEWLLGAALVAILVWGFVRDPRRSGDRTGDVDHDALQRGREEMDARHPPPPSIPPTSY